MNAATQPWSRRRLLGILTLSALVAAVLLAGLGLALRQALTGRADPADVTVVAHRPATLPDRAAARRAALLSAPMLQVPATAATQGTPAAAPAPVMTVPATTRTGPARVPTGLPRTPEGAVAQLAAIETTVLASMSIPRAHEVHAAWTQEGAAPAERWVMTTNVQRFLAAAGQPGQVKGAEVAVTARPVAGQVKGADGPDWVVACVLLDITVTAGEQARAAYGHCEALAWERDRWVIASGPAPAPAPSTWPGSDLAVQAGWRTWTSTTGE